MLSLEDMNFCFARPIALSSSKMDIVMIQTQGPGSQFEGLWILFAFPNGKPLTVFSVH